MMEQQHIGPHDLAAIRSECGNDVADSDHVRFLEILVALILYR
jgi:hypothetical protein